MDLAKAKSIMVIILVTFNIFLLSINLSYSREQGIQPDTIRNAVSILNARGVKIECKIPENPNRTSKLIYGAGKLDKRAILKAFSEEIPSEQGDINVYEYNGKRLAFSGDTKFTYYDESPNEKINITKDDEAVKYARNYLKNKGLLKGKYILDEVSANQDGSFTIRFVEKYYDFLIFDNYITVTLTGKGLREIEYNKVEVLGFSAVASKDIAAAYQVLLAHFRQSIEVSGNRGNETNGENEASNTSVESAASSAVNGEFGQDGVVITQIDIGYKFAPDQSINGIESMELLPVWRVKMKGISEPLYLNTYDSSHF